MSLFLQSPFSSSQRACQAFPSKISPQEAKSELSPIHLVTPLFSHPYTTNHTVIISHVIFPKHPVKMASQGPPSVEIAVEMKQDWSNHEVNDVIRQIPMARPLRKFAKAFFNTRQLSPDEAREHPEYVAIRPQRFKLDGSGIGDMFSANGGRIHVPHRLLRIGVRIKETFDQKHADAKKLEEKYHQMRPFNKGDRAICDTLHVNGIPDVLMLIPMTYDKIKGLIPGECAYPVPSSCVDYGIAQTGNPGTVGLDAIPKTVDLGTESNGQKLRLSNDFITAIVADSDDLMSLDGHLLDLGDPSLWVKRTIYNSDATPKTFLFTSTPRRLYIDPTDQNRKSCFLGSRRRPDGTLSNFSVSWPLHEMKDIDVVIPHIEITADPNVKHHAPYMIFPEVGPYDIWDAASRLGIRFGYRAKDGSIRTRYFQCQETTYPYGKHHDESHHNEFLLGAWTYSMAWLATLLGKTWLQRDTFDHWALTPFTVRTKRMNMCFIFQSFVMTDQASGGTIEPPRLMTPFESVQKLHRYGSLSPQTVVGFIPQSFTEPGPGRKSCDSCYVVSLIEL